jgi:hypothetical protein
MSATHGKRRLVGEDNGERQKRQAMLSSVQNNLKPLNNRDVAYMNA